MNTVEQIEYQFSITTADEEKNYYSSSSAGTDPFETEPPASPALQSGLYRVIDGQLFRVVSGLPVAM